MWTFTAYIILKLCEAKGSDSLDFSDLRRFVFDVLRVRYGVGLVDSGVELEREVRYLSRLGVLDFDGRVIRINGGELRRIALVVEDSQYDALPIYGEYVRRINRAVGEVV